MVEEHRFAGRLYAKASAAYMSAQVWCDETGVLWCESQIDPAAKVVVKEVLPQVANVPPVLCFADGRRFMPDAPLPEAFYDTKTGILHWFERVSFGKAILMILLLVLFAVGIRSTIPHIADVAVVLVPKHWDVDVGDNAMALLDEVFFEPSQLSDAQRDEISALMTPLYRVAYKQDEPYQRMLLFRSSKLLGANALALPGGVVVVTDDIIKEFNGYPDEIQAILAHELAHVQLRHGMRNALRALGWSAMIFIAGLESGAIEEVLYGYGIISQLSYSRSFELEADQRAAEMLSAIGADPLSLSRALSRLEESVCGEEGCGEQGMVSTHPDFGERYRHIEQQ